MKGTDLQKSSGPPDQLRHNAQLNTDLCELGTAFELPIQQSYNMYINVQELVQNGFRIPVHLYLITERLQPMFRFNNPVPINSLISAFLSEIWLTEESRCDTGSLNS